MSTEPAPPSTPVAYAPKHMGCGCLTGHACDRQRLIEHGRMATTVYTVRDVLDVARDLHQQHLTTAHLLWLRLTEPIVTEEPERDSFGGRTVTVTHGVIDPAVMDTSPAPSAPSAAADAGRAADAPGPSCPPAFPSDGA